MLLALIVVAGLFFLQKLSIIPSWKNWFRSKPLLIENSAIIVTEVKNIAELTTTQVYAEIVVDSMEASKLAMANQALKNAGLLSVPFLKADRLVMIVKGKVQAGVNLKKLDSSAIHVYEDSISMRLPKAEILDVITNPSDFETFIEDGDWSDAAVLALKQNARRKLLAKAADMQILTKANDRAFTVIEELLRSLGFKKVYIFN